MKLRGILICAIAVALGLAPHLAGAVPVTFTWGSFSAAGLTTFGVYDSDNVTILATGDLAQLIWAGPNGAIDLPKCDGAPGGDDQLLTANTIQNAGTLPPTLRNKGYLPLQTWTFDSESEFSGGVVYIRAWNDPTPSLADVPFNNYGNSTTSTLAPDATFNAPRWYTNRICDPTAVLLASFEARAVGSAIRVTWETVSEIDLAGFNVWRSTAADGDYSKQNGALIPGSGSPLHGAAYAHDDTAVTSGTTYYYKLETVSTGGQTTLTGPVSAAPGSDFRVFLPLIMR